MPSPTDTLRVAVPLEQCWHDVPGGTARSALDLAAALDARDDVSVVGVSARHAGPPAEPWRPAVPVASLPLPRPLLYEAWHALRRPRIERATGPVDVCHAVGGAVPGTRAPLVVTVHDLAFLHLPGLFTAQGRRFLRRALHLVRDHADQVQVPSLATAADCEAHGIERARIRHVPWGCSVGDPSPAEVAAARARHGLEGPYVVCVGTLEPRKNLPRLVEAWRRLGRDDARLVLIGPDGWGELPDGSRLPGNVSMTGFVDAATRDALYAGATASCYPSLLEGYGLPVLESMALGCPVVTSAGTATEELVAGGAGVAVDPTDVDAIAGALAALLDDPGHRERLAAAGRARAATRTWAGAAEAAAAGYREVVR